MKNYLVATILVAWASVLSVFAYLFFVRGRTMALLGMAVWLILSIGTAFNLVDLMEKDEQASK